MPSGLLEFNNANQSPMTYTENLSTPVPETLLAISIVNDTNAVPPSIEHGM